MLWWWHHSTWQSCILTGRKEKINAEFGGGAPEQLGLGEILIPAPLKVEMLVTCYLVMSYVASIVDDAVPF